MAPVRQRRVPLRLTCCMQAVARDAGALIRKAFLLPAHSSTVEAKASVVDLVTETDRASEELIMNRLAEAFPGFGFIGEEAVSAAGHLPALTSAPTWVVDPLDGTTNFVHRFPFVAVCIGLCVAREPVLGVVYLPMLDELFSAVHGRGATLNGDPIRVSQQDVLGRSIVAAEMGSQRNAAKVAFIVDNLRLLIGEPEPVHSIRCLGSAACNTCYVAKGALDAYWEHGPWPWDFAAASVIAREAGAHITCLDGSPFAIDKRQILVAATPALAQRIASLLVPLQA